MDERKLITRYSTSSVDLDMLEEGEAIVKIKEVFANMREVHPDGVHFKLDSDDREWDSDQRYLYVTCRTPETDEEYAKRLGRDEKSKQFRMKQFEALKKEFGE
jgi:hypothetical protein